MSEDEIEFLPNKAENSFNIFFLYCLTNFMSKNSEKNE